MKKILLILAVLGSIWGCSADETLFDIPMPQEGITFTPVAGGAVMHYRLPVDDDIFAIRVRYRNAAGKEELRSGSYACDSLLIEGFDESVTGVKAMITLCDRAGNESAPIEKTFDTKDSGPILFFKELKVEPAWNGFKFSYNVPEDTDGMAHVLYVGKDLQTGLADTILLNSFYFSKGTDTLDYIVQQEQKENTVVIRTENIQTGRMVKQEIYEKVTSHQMELLNPENYLFEDPEGLSLENEETKLSKEYLFDGDTKGATSFGQPSTVFGTYLAGPEAFDKPLFIIDLKKAVHLAEVRLYTITEIKRNYLGLFRGFYEEKLPNKVSIYATNDKEDEESWVLLGKFEQDKALDAVLRWCARVPSSKFWNDDDGFLKTIEAIEAAPSYYMSIQFPVDAAAYRYLKVVVHETFDSVYGPKYSNSQHYVTFHEFEVYTKKN